MTDPSVPPVRPAPDASVARDLEALSGRTARNLPLLETTLAAARDRRDNPLREGFFVNAIQSMKRRPWAAGAVVTVLAVLVLSIVPISYNRTVGHDLTLTLSGPGVTADDVAQVAREFKSILGSKEVRVSAEMEGGSASYVLRGRVPAAGLVGSRLFARSLEEKGYTASVASTPVVERVSSPMFAYARDRVIEIAVDGKTSAQLEDEIRQKLLDAGLRDVSVQVTDQGDNKREIRINAEQTVEGEEGEATTEIPQVVLTKEGQPIAGEKEESHTSVRITRNKESDGSLTLKAEVTVGTQTATATVPRSESLSQADLAREIESQLRAAGLNVSVTIEDGRLRVTEAE